MGGDAAEHPVAQASGAMHAGDDQARAEVISRRENIGANAPCGRGPPDGFGGNAMSMEEADRLGRIADGGLVPNA